MENVLVVVRPQDPFRISRKESVNLAIMIVKLALDQVPINVKHVG